MSDNEVIVERREGEAERQTPLQTLVSLGTVAGLAAFLLVLMVVGYVFSALFGIVLFVLVLVALFSNALVRVPRQHKWMLWVSAGVLALLIGWFWQ